jgi:hypothetical protein
MDEQGEADTCAISNSVEALKIDVEERKKEVLSQDKPFTISAMTPPELRYRNELLGE